MAAAGVPPRVMGIGPVPSTRKLMERLNLKSAISTGSSSMKRSPRRRWACLRQLGLPDDAAACEPERRRDRARHPLGMSAHGSRSPQRINDGERGKRAVGHHVRRRRAGRVARD